MKIIANIRKYEGGGCVDETNPKEAVEALGWKLGTQHPSEEDGLFEVEVPDNMFEGKFYKGHDAEYSAIFLINHEFKQVLIDDGTGPALWEIEIGDPDNDSWCPTETTWVGGGRF